MESGRLRELRHDFRHYYSVRYEDVELGEALDLVLSLPQGSHFKGSLVPALKWTQEQYALADINDILAILLWRMAGCPGEMPQLTERPGDRAMHESQAKAEKERVAKVKAGLNQTKWEDVQ